MGSKSSTTAETNSDWEDSSLSESSKPDTDIEELTFESNEAFQGWLEKKSKAMGSWRKQWAPKGDEPTEQILVNRQIIVSTDDADDRVFTIYDKVSNSSFLFRTAHVGQRDEWISILQQHGEYEDNDHYKLEVVQDDEDTATLKVVHTATKQSWSALIESESQREYFQSPNAEWTLKVDPTTYTLTVSPVHGELTDMVLNMDTADTLHNVKVTRSAVMKIDGDEDDEDDQKEPVPMQPVEPELSEQQKKNLESYKEYTFSFHLVEGPGSTDTDSVRIEMQHIALDLDFAVTLDHNWPWKKPVEEDAVEEIDGAAVNELFGNEDSDDDSDSDTSDGDAAALEPKGVSPPPRPSTIECIVERKQSNAMEVALKGSGKTAHVELQFELNGVWQTVELAQTAASIERLAAKENAASYALYEMAMEYTKETFSLRIDIKHLESGRDFEVTLDDAWLKSHFPEKYNHTEPEQVVAPYEEPDPEAVNALFGNDDSSDDEEEEVTVDAVVAPDAESKEEDPTEEAVEELLGLMECIRKCKEYNTLAMTMKGSNKTASIELRFTMDGQTELIEVARSAECIQKQTEMEQKEENTASYALYEMAITEETLSLHIDIKHLESGRDFEVTLDDTWLKSHFPENYKSGPEQVVPDVDPDPEAVNALFGNVDSSEDEEEEAIPLAPYPGSAAMGALNPNAAPIPMTAKLLVLMECIRKCKESATLAMTKKGSNKTASIDLRFTMDGQGVLIEVARSLQCIQRQTEMEQKEEMANEEVYISGIKGVAESGYGQYCAIEGLVDRHTFKQHKNDNPDPQSVNSRKIMRELRKTLAKGVYLSYSNGSMFVRFDESNPRFLQAMLVGLKGTPYFNGCFLFDIYLPDEYPVKPCKVKHISNGAQLCHANNGPGGFSPNLHQSSGKVCLSLLGTWSGPGWEANKSNVYQLLSTLLLMVFGAEHPYYMEPSYGGWEGTAYNITKHDPKVIQYDEEVLYHTAKSTILDIIRKPYTGFEDIIKTHFRLKANQMRSHFEEILQSGTYSDKFKKKVEPIYKQIEEELEKM